MADITISVGAQIDKNFEQFKNDIKALYNELNSNPLKVKVQFDEASVKSMQSQITALYNSVNKLNSGSSGNAATQATQQATQAAKTRAAAEQQTTNTINQRASADQKATSAAQQSASAAEKDAKAEIARANAISQYNTRLTQIQNALNKYTAAEHSRNQSSREAYGILKQQEAEMLSYKSAVDSNTASMDKMKTMTANAGAVLKQQTQIITQNGDATKSVTDRIGSLVGKFSSWLTISQTVMFAFNSMRKMVTASIELDTAMTELKKVTNETDATYSTFLDNASTRATKLGASLSDAVTATADFARLGYSIEDAEKLSDAATIYKNVGDGIEDISQASESIIATMQAFGTSANDAMSIVDKFNEVGNNYAISSEGVGEALLRSAAAMSAANNTLDETIALATAANTIVQNPESVGTTLKTVSMYLRAAKTEAEEAGESTDGMASSVSELRDEILALTGNKVDIQLDDDTFKSTYQILKELSEIWDELTDVSQANILEMVGGKRNANVVSALLENFSIAENALATSLDSVGSATAENEKCLDSVQGKINIMKASFQTLSSDFMSSSFLKDVISVLTEIINILDTLISKVGTLPTIIGAIGIGTLIKNFGSSNEFALYGCKSIVA